ncbi:MAG: M20 family metallopeptidase [Streptosporangiaceae bacterium]
MSLDRMTGELAALVGCESPTGDTGACRDLVAELGTGLLGAAPQSHGEHLLWSFGAPRVLLLGHFDTVWPRGTLARWPFTVTGSRATGPGCFDMKAGLVQIFHALAGLDDLDGVAVLLTSDEETGSPSSRALIEDTARSVAAVLVTEPSADGALKTSRKGLARYQLEITGRAAHSGLDPERGVNAGVELAHQTLAVAALGDAGRGTTVTPTVSSAGTTSNTVPGAARLAVDVRAYDSAELRRVDAAIHALRTVHPEAALTVADGPRRGPLQRSSSFGLFQLAAALATELGMPPLREASVGGGSDGNLTGALGIPTLDGLGAVGGNAHAEGEWLDLAALPARTELLRGLIARLREQ